MFSKKYLKIIIFLCISVFFLNSCANRGDARKSPPDPKLRVKKNIEEGRGFRLMDSVNKNKATNYQFATSNELWRASLDILDFMPLSSVNYSGGIIITDWYSSDEKNNESIKITIRFLSNEIRSDALNIKVFKKVCKINNHCKISESSSKIATELRANILKNAKIYQEQNADKNFKTYKPTKVPEGKN